MDKQKLNTIITWIIVLIVAITVFWYAFGNSPTFEQSLIIFMLGLFSTFGKEYYSFKQNVMLSFSKVSNDISHIRRDIGEIRTDIEGMKKDISEIKQSLNKK